MAKVYERDNSNNNGSKALLGAQYVPITIALYVDYFVSNVSTWSGTYY